MFTKKFNNLSDSLIEAAAKTLANPIVNEASNETPTINHLELSEEELSELTMKANPKPTSKLVTPMRTRQGAVNTAGPKASYQNTQSPQPDNFAAADQELKKRQAATNAAEKLRALGLDPESLPRNYRAEELVGNQHKIDMNKNGRIDSDDFKKLRNEQPQLSAQDRAELRQGRDPFRGDTTTAPRMNRPAAPPAPKPAPPAPPVAPRATMPTPSTTSAAPTPRPQIQLPMAPASQFGQTKVTPTHLYNPDTKETKPVPDEMRKSVSESMRSHLRELLKLNEAKRGRKPKDGGDPGDEASYVDPETGERSAPPNEHIFNRLRQAAQSMKAQHSVTYADGSTHNVPKHVAKALVNAYQDPSKKPYEREAMQAKIGQSHKELMQYYSELNLEDSYNPPNGKKKMLLEPGVDKKNKKELDEVPVETVKQVRMFQQDEEQAVSNRDEEPPFKPDAKRTKRPDEPTTARGLARAAMRRAMEKAKQNEEVNEEQIDESNMVWRDDTAHSEPHPDQDTIQGHKKAIEFWVAHGRFAKTENERRRAMRKMADHQGKIHTMERQGFRDKEEVNEVSSRTLQSYKSKALDQVDDMSNDLRGKYMNQVDPEKLRRRASGIQLSQKKLKGTAKIGATHEEAESIDERHMSDSEMENRENIVKGMKKGGGVAEFKKRYGRRWREVMYATATKQAMKEETPKGADGVKVEPEMPFQGSGGVQSTKV